MQPGRYIAPGHRKLALATILALAGTIGACERSDSAERALANASAKLEANSGGSFASPYQQIESKNYKDAITAATPVRESSANSPQGAAAATMIAAAQLGQAQSQLAEAADAEQVALARMSVINALLSNWVAYSLSAASASDFDPSAMLAEIAADRADREKEIQANQAKLDETERRLADLRAKSKQLNEQADKLSEDYAKVRESLASISASEAETRLSAAREQKRKGDAIRVEASRLDAQVSVTQPEADELKVLIAADRDRIAGLDREKLELNEKAQQGRADSAQSRAAADDTAKQLETALSDLARDRAGGVNAKYDAAISSLRTAVKTAKGASSDPSTNSKLVTGRAQLSLAGALASKASSLSLYASLLQRTADASPALPFASKIAGWLKEANDLAKNSTEEAKTAYLAAQSAFSSVQLRGPGTTEIKEQLTKLAETIGKLAGQTPAPAGAPAAPAPESKPVAAGAPAGAATPAATPATPSLKDPAGAWAIIFPALQKGDAATLMPHVKLADPAHEQVIKGMLVIAAANQDLDAACKEKFGKTLTEFMAQSAGQKAPSAADFKIEVQGDTATLSNPLQTVPMKLVRDGGEWKLDSASVASGPAGMLAQVSAPLAAAAKAVSADIRAGKITKIEEVSAEFQKRAAAAMKPGGGG